VLSGLMMIYVVGIAGFIGGFICGQMLLLFLLRHKSNKDLTNDKSLGIYGMLNWLVAILGAVSMVYLYKLHYVSLN
jgi:hypothetical protein